MTSRTGNKSTGFTPLEKKSNRTNSNFLTGFTLIEIMVATMVLSLGAVMIYEAYFLSLYASNYCYDYLNVVSWADEQIWEAQDNLNRLGILPQEMMSGGFRENSKDFKWGLSYGPAGEAGELYNIDLVVNWRESGKAIKLSRSAVALRYAERE